MADQAANARLSLNEVYSVIGYHQAGQNTANNNIRRGNGAA
jgi:hypothetical protein